MTSQTQEMKLSFPPTKTLDDLRQTEALHQNDNFQQRLIATVLEGYLNDTIELLKNGAAVNARDKDGQTPLFAAVCAGVLEVVKLHLSYGARIQTWDQNFRTPLSVAAEGGNMVIVQYLLFNGASLEIKDREARSPTTWAAKSGHERVVLMLEKFALQEQTITSHHNPSQLQPGLGNCLVYLASEYRVEDIKLCLQYGASLNISANTSGSATDSISPLGAALAGCKLDHSLQLLEDIPDGADDLRNIWKSIDIVTELLRHDINICLREDSYEQVLIAALAVAIKCERLPISTLANFRKTVGIALLANDAAGNWAVDMIRIIEGSWPLWDGNYKGVDKILSNISGNGSSMDMPGSQVFVEHRARTAAEALLGVYSHSIVWQSDERSKNMKRRRQEIDLHKQEGNERFQKRTFDAALQSYDLGIQVIQDHGIPECDWKQILFILHSNRLQCLIKLNRYEWSDYEHMLEMCRHQYFTAVVEPAFLAKALFRCAIFGRTFKDKIRAGISLEKCWTLDPQNKDVRRMMEELFGATAERANNLGYHNYTITFFESISWWTNGRIKGVQEQFSTQYAFMTEGVKKYYSQEDPLESKKDQMLMKRSWVTLGEAFPSLKRDDLYQALGSIGFELALYAFQESDISKFDDINGQMRSTAVRIGELLAWFNPSSK